MPDFNESKTTYHYQKGVQNALQLREVLSTMPSFTKTYFRAIEPRTSSRTRLAYAYDIRTFFRFLQQENPVFRDTPIASWTLDMLEQIESEDIEEYMEFLKVYKISAEMTGADHEAMESNSNVGLHRKLSALRSFYAYYFKNKYIKSNPTLLVNMPKLARKAIVRLDDDEISTLLDVIEHTGDTLTGQKKAYFEKNKLRDLAIVTLMLGTGIRVSECVGLDIQDVDFRNGGIRIIRKGGDESIVYFGDEVEDALRKYIEEDRVRIQPLPGHENALFYSTQRKRMGVQAVENMVKKYTQKVTTTKKISPHKLRSTYGTALYRETGDIYLVADVLGHKDVNTTRDRYAAMDDNRRRKAANAVKLRE